MASGFKVLIHRDEGSLHLKLKGDLDVAGADELIKLLQRNSADARRVFIHTSCLSRIDPCVREQLEKAFKDLHIPSHSTLFTGDNAGLIAPEESMRI